MEGTGGQRGEEAISGILQSGLLFEDMCELVKQQSQQDYR